MIKVIKLILRILIVGILGTFLILGNYIIIMTWNWNTSQLLTIHKVLGIGALLTDLSICIILFVFTLIGITRVLEWIFD